MKVLHSGTLAEQLIPAVDFSNPADSRDAAMARDVALVVVGVALLTFCAQVTIPWHPVPLTGQTFAVLLIGGLYGMVRATIALAAYFTIGLLGVGVFANESGGWDYVQGPTGGYLVGFIIAAGFVGYMAERGLDRKVVPMIGVLLIATAIIYGLGAWWLAEWNLPDTGERFGWSAAYSSGVEPFLLGDMVKLVAVAGLLPAGWKLAERLGLYTKKRGDPDAGIA